jgi:hypothetical protein
MGRLPQILILAALALVPLGCEAALETTCVGGDGSCDQHALGSGSTTTSAGGGPVCYEGCDTESLSGNVGDYPCAVDAIVDNCRRCHTEPQEHGAPFSLETYEDSQQLYFGKARWARMEAVVSADIMPAEEPKLTALEKFRLLDDWACQCAPPREAGVSCP